MAGIITLLVVGLPILACFYFMHGRDKSSLAEVSVAEAVEFAANNGLFVPQTNKAYAPVIESGFAGHACLIRELGSNKMLGKTHFWPSGWLGKLDCSLRAGDVLIAVATSLSVTPYGFRMTFTRDGRTEGEAFLTPGADGVIGQDRRMWTGELQIGADLFELRPKKFEKIPRGHEIYLGDRPIGSALHLVPRLDQRVLLLDPMVSELSVLALFYVCSYGFFHDRS